MNKNYSCLNVSEAEFKELLKSNDYKCNAAGRAFMAERVKVIKPRHIEWSAALFKAAEELGGLKPGSEFEYNNAQGGYSTARVVNLYDLPENMVNPYLYCFSGIMHAPLYAFEALRFFAKKTGQVLPFISSGKEGNKGLFYDLFYREEDALIRDTEYDSYYRIMDQLGDHDWVYENYTKCDDTDTEGNLVELYQFAKNKGLDEITFVMVSGNPYYDKRLLAEWMWQLNQDKFADVRINLVLVHCPVWYSYNRYVIPEAQVGSEIAMGYIAASLGPLYKDTITFDGKTTSERPERYLMPGVAEADWEMFRDLIMNYSNMGWPNYQELLYGVDHETAVENIILSDLFARASFTPEDYDSGISMMLEDYKYFLGGGFNAKTQKFEDYLKGTTEKKFF
jgi:hypothetical protein